MIENRNLLQSNDGVIFNENLLVSFEDRTDTVQVKLRPLPLELRYTFGTSHSSTNTRENALLEIKINNEMSVFSEAGLPPKREHVYCADLNDTKNLVVSWFSCLSEILDSCPLVQSIKSSCNKIHDNNNKKIVWDSLTPWEGLEGYDQGFSVPLVDLGTDPSIENEPNFKVLIKSMLSALDVCSLSKESCSSAGKAMVETGVFQIISSKLSLPVHSLLHSEMSLSSTAPSPPTFYTVALNDSIDEMIESAKFGRQFTPYLKIKVNGDFPKIKEVLTRLNKEFPDNNENKQWWSVDANCAWTTPETCMKMLNSVLMPFANRMLMVEQHFPIELLLNEESLDAETKKAWKEVKSAYNQAGFRLFADESMRTVADIPHLLSYVDGVNIKLEKCGGYRGALRAVRGARSAGLSVWFGCMVGSTLNSCSTAHLVPFVSSHSGTDLDGSLLVKDESQLFSGGFQYKNGHIFLPNLPGLGLQKM